MGVCLAIFITAIICTPLGFIVCAVISGNKYNDYEDKITELNDRITQQQDMLKCYGLTYEDIKTKIMKENNGGIE